MFLEKEMSTYFSFPMHFLMFKYLYLLKKVKPISFFKIVTIYYYSYYMYKKSVNREKYSRVLQSFVIKLTLKRA